MSTHTAAGAATAPRSRPRAALPALCVTQITSWGVIYYAFPVQLPHLTTETGWPAAACTGAFSAALLVSAAAGIPIGRILDRHGPRLVMTSGSILGVLAILGVALAPNLPVFIAAWLLAGIAMAATFYQPAFAALTRWWGPDRLRALTTLTLAGGLASTVFAPLTAALDTHLDWRHTYLALAAILAALTIPAHALGLRAPWPEPPTDATPAHTRAGRDATLHSRPFLLLATALTLSAFTAYVVVIAIVPLLTARGASATTAAWALGLGGAGQTLGRTLHTTLARHTNPTTRTAALIATSATATAALGLIPGPVPLLVALAIAAGMIRGNLTLLQATAVIDRWGTTRYARRSAYLAAPITIATATTPFASATLANTLGGYPTTFTVLAVVAATGALLATATRPPDPAPTATPTPAHEQGT